MKESWKSAVTLAVAALAFSPLAAQAQAAASNQGVFNDEQQMLQTDGAMINQYTQAENKAEGDLRTEEQRNQAYRLYAEQRINQLEEYKKRGSPALSGSKAGDLPMLEAWLKNDDAYRAKQQSYIDQLNQLIINLRQSQTQTLANLNNDIAGMRQNEQDRKDQQRFQNQMQINQFNELQSEMGACSWGGTPNDGYYNSTGGYGVLGGYGYSPMAGRSGMMRGGF
ncbi:MAG: hypothetical protein JSS83_02855 [Cyanobacteria bacterium SZAS LIN-3]|nr:hypothetical protein [Cyanobacteria bacterium SZAS LIN-3]